MRRHSHRPLTLKAISRDLNRRPEYLGALFRGETGRGFQERLTQIRLRRAARMLREGEKIEAVILLVGYRNKRNFYVQFRRVFGLRPGEYRARVRQGSGLVFQHRSSASAGRQRGDSPEPP
jgi:two-component system response regulator YesN